MAFKPKLFFAFLLTGSATAYADTEFYARMNLDAQQSDEGNGSFSEVKSNNSWIGVKGNLALENDIEAIYRLEWKVDITQESGSQNLTERPQYVGLKGGFGQVIIGRDFTPVWELGREDLFNHYEGDIKGLWKGENRLSDIVAYTSPTWNKIHGSITYQAEKEEEGDSATSAGLFYGDRQFKSADTYAGVAHDFDVAGYDLTRFLVEQKIGAHVVGAMFQTQEASEGNADSEQGWLINYRYKQGNFTWKGQYQTLEDDDSLSVGVDYSLGKMTKVFGWYTRLDKESNESDFNYLAIGIEHKLSYKF